MLYGIIVHEMYVHLKLIKFFFYWNELINVVLPVWTIALLMTRLNKAEKCVWLITKPVNNYTVFFFILRLPSVHDQICCQQ